MIPILFDRYETNFTSNGLGRLADCVECLVTEERNGIYECEFTYPVTGQYFNYIEPGMIIYATHDDSEDPQPFIIYASSAPISGLVTFYAHHISYKLNDIVVEPYTAASCSAALLGVGTNSINDNPFTFWTDKSVTADFAIEVPTAARAVMGGDENSILEIYGGEYEFDMYDVKLHASRGDDTQVEIRYGKNLVDINAEKDTTSMFDAVVPFWTGIDDNDETILVMLSERLVVYNSDTEASAYLTDQDIQIVQTEDATDIVVNGQTLRTVSLDLTDQFEEQPTQAQLRQAARAYLEMAQGWLPVESIEVDFVQLWQTEEYAEYAPLQRVHLCDTVSVYYPQIGIVRARQKVVKTVYNTLLDRFDSIELGELQTSLAEEITRNIDLDNYVTQRELSNTQSAINAMIETLSTQIDAKIETWVSSSDPSNRWTTATTQAEHDGDLWLYTGLSIIIGGSTTIYPQGVYQYDGDNDAWVAYSSTSDNLFDLADGKTTIYYGTTSGTYSDVEEGDYLVDNTDGSTYRWNSFQWVKQTDYASAISSMQTTLNNAITNATQKITGGLGGYVYLKPNANGYPEEILIMNTQDYTTATKIWRWNVNGFGYSSTGYSGTYGTAITMDGEIVADYITAGTMNANIIRAGVLQDVNGNTSFDLASGLLSITKGSINLGTGNFTVDNTGAVVAKSITLGNRITLYNNGLLGAYTDSSGNYQETVFDYDGINCYYDNVSDTTPWNRSVTIDPRGSSFSEMLYVDKDVAYLGGSDASTPGIGFGTNGTYALFFPDSGSVSGAPNIRMNTDNNRIRRTTWTPSSKEYKKNITTEFCDELDPKRLYDIDVVQYDYNDAYQAKFNLDKDDSRYGKTHTGIIIEELDKIWPLAVDKDNKDDPKTWSRNDAHLVPPMLKLIQEQHDELVTLRAALDEIKERIAELERVKK